MNEIKKEIFVRITVVNNWFVFIETILILSIVHFKCSSSRNIERRIDKFCRRKENIVNDIMIIIVI